LRIKRAGIEQVQEEAKVETSGGKTRKQNADHNEQGMLTKGKIWRPRKQPCGSNVQGLNKKTDPQIPNAHGTTFGEGPQI
jgi:hypothetical protein